MTHPKDEALDLALEALEFWDRRGVNQPTEQAITAIKQARSAQVQEPVAIPDCGEAGHAEGACGNRECLPSFRRNTTPPAAQPAPVQDDIADFIAGAFGVSRGTAYDLMREALAQERSSDEQPAQQEPVAWVPYLSDRADGVKGHYAIARWNPRGYREVWNLRRHEWGAYSDDVLSLEEADTLLRLITIPTRKVTSPQPAQQEPVAWRNAAIRVGEDLCSVGPFGYYDMTAEQWLDWALSVVTVHALYTTPPAAPVQEPTLQKQLDDALSSLDFYKRRVDALQQWQSKMRDPERTIVCDIIANGCTLDPAGNRYTPPAAQPAPVQEPEKLECMNCAAFGECNPNNDAGRCGYEPPAAPAQEPIGYFTVNDYDKWEEIDNTSGKPLYEHPAAQRQSARSAWVGLTDEEIDKLFGDGPYVQAMLLRDVARAIEAKLREKNAAQPAVPLTDEQQIAEALRQHGLTLVKTSNGYAVLRLGQIDAHGITEKGGAA